MIIIDCIPQEAISRGGFKSCSRSNVKFESQVYSTTRPSFSFDEVYFDPQQQFLFLPTRMIEQLDLMPFASRRCLIDGVARILISYAAVKLTINERSCSTDVLEIPDLETPILGTIPLQLMDFVVDHEQRNIVGNPAHDGEERYDLLLQNS